jgi:hypothetical protein
MDSAGYNMDLLRYCCEGRSPWGVIHFGISVPMYLPYRETVQKLPEDAWQRLDDTTEWAEVNMVTNKFEEPGEQVIHWQRGRCGKSEEIHGILKNGLAGGHVPTGDFGANAAWWYLAVLSFNLQRFMTHHLLPAGWARVHQKRLLATIYSSPARLIRHAGQIVLKIYGKVGKIIEEAHWKLLRLHMMLE